MDGNTMRGAWIAATMLWLVCLPPTADANDLTSREAGASTDAADSSWDVTVGAGILIKPEFSGADEVEALVLPYFNLTWGERVFFNVVDGLGAHLYARGGLSIDGGIGFHFGRDEDDDPVLEGLGDVGFAPTLRLRADYRVGWLSTFADVDKHIGGTEGTQVELGLRTAIPLALLIGRPDGAPPAGTNPFTQGPVLAVSLSAEYADDKYLSGFYGVDSVQSARSGLTPYNPTAGFASAGAGVLLLYPVTDRWALNALGSYARIIGNAADSPTVIAQDQFGFGVFATYRF